MIQEDQSERVCVVAVLGTPEEAAAFVRQLQGGDRLPAAAQNPASAEPTTTRADEAPIAVGTASGAAEASDERDRAIAWLRRRGGLTTSECVVLALRARGFTNSAIARVLGIEVGTVKCHVNHAIRRLGDGAGDRPARVIAQALDRVRGAELPGEADDGEWIRMVTIARARLEPRVEDADAIGGRA